MDEFTSDNVWDMNGMSAILIKIYITDDDLQS